MANPANPAEHAEHAEHEESLPLRGLHALAPWAWRGLVFAVVLLAIYVASGRYLMQQVPALRDPLLEQLNQRLPFQISVAQLSGGWNAFSPEMRFNDLELGFRDPSLKPVILDRGSLRLDVPASLASLGVQFSRLEVSGLNLDARLNEDGSIKILGFGGGDGEALRAWLEEFLPNVQRVDLSGNHLALETIGGVLELDLDLLLQREGNTRSLQGQLRSDDLSLAVNAEGVGNPLKPLSWSGDLYVDASSDDLLALSNLWESMEWPFTLAGAAGAEFWLTRSGGDSSARLRVRSEGLQIDEQGGAWSLPVDALSFEAALEQRSRHWSLLTEDFHIERGGQAVDLDRAQFDWWGQALRIRASDLSLDALPGLLAAAPGIPQGLRDALPDLAPAGELDSVEVRLDDLARPQNTWSVRARLDDLAIDSWSARRTPALTGVTGYLVLDADGGELQLDATNFSMFYPTVYEAPLAYDETRGAVYLNWDSEGLMIDSGLMELVAEEGLAHGLFAVDIPFRSRPTGVELDLLIGLADSHVRHRAKYLPYTLPPSLSDWLNRSILDGAIETGGFIWRGSTRKEATGHRTLQLFLDVSDASLSYDPAWPQVDAMDATVWVDDGRTFGRAATGITAGLSASETMVRVLPGPGRTRLDLDGALAGDAAAAQVLFGETPLREVTSGVFEDWTFAGQIDGALVLGLDLVKDNQSVPSVDLSVNLSDVAAEVAQAELSMEAVSGLLSYHSERGFAGSSVSGQLLGGRFSADAGDRPLPGLELNLVGDVEAGAIADWLDLEPLNFATGTAAFGGQLTLDETEGAWLRLESELQGVTLDAPRPFLKTAEQPLPLQIAVPLVENPSLAMALGERLRVHMAMQDGRMGQLVAAVGGGDPDVGRCDQRYCLGGTVSSLDMLQWRDFYRQYFQAPIVAEAADATEVAMDLAVGEPALATPEGSQPESPALPFSYRVDSLSVGELQLGERSLGAARFDLWGVDELWQGAVEASWTQGSLTREGDDLQLLIEYLDLERLSGGDPTPLDDFRNFLPSMRVDVLELRDGDRQLGSVGFDLDMSQSDGALYATGIEGQLWNLTLNRPQPGMLRWESDAGQEYTSIELDAVYEDFADVLRAAEFAPTLESDRGSASVRLRWPGGPTAFAAADASGSLVLSASNGRVLEANSGALGIISFLNLAEILRGLSLTHMFEAGIPFLTASTEMYLHAGMVEIVDMQIDGAASAFAFNGVSDLTLGSIDGELVVTLPVANNLPWVAALAAGLPVAAGVFVVSKVFEKQVNRMSSAVYGVSGDIGDPDVEFRRLFDDSLSPAPAVPEDSGTGDG